MSPTFLRSLNREVRFMGMMRRSIYIPTRYDRRTPRQKQQADKFKSRQAWDEMWGKRS